MGVPVIKDYYRATLLDQLKTWFDPSPVKQWVLLEHNLVQNNNLRALLIAAATNKPLHLPDHPSISALLKAWIDLLDRVRNPYIYPCVIFHFNPLNP